MSRKKYAVCLLALAGSATLFCSTFHFNRSPQRRSSPVSSASAKFASSRARATAFSNLPVTFEPDTGQAGRGVQFIGRVNGLTVLLGNDGIGVGFTGRDASNTSATNQFVEIRLAKANAGLPRKKGRAAAKSSRPRRRRHGTSSRPRRRRQSRSYRRTSSRAENAKRLAWHGEGKLQAESNYFIGNDRSSWRTHVPHYSAVKTENVVPGVAMRVYGDGSGVEYDLRLEPGVDASTLRLKTGGAGDAVLAANGDLMLRAGRSELHMKRPVVYEETLNGSRSQGIDRWDANSSGLLRTSPKILRRIDGAYVLEADGSIGFAIGLHDTNKALIIDPSLYVTYATFLGGAGSDTASSVALDSSGNVYIGGTTTGPGSFAEPNAATLGSGILGSGNSSGANTEYFIAKINPNASGASSLVYLTFIGGSASQSED